MPAMHSEVRIAELSLSNGVTVMRIECGPALVPAAGRYLWTCDVDGTEVLGTPLYLAQVLSDGFIAAPTRDHHWQPDTRLSVRGPLGRGFEMSGHVRRVALLAVDGEPHCLLPLVQPALANGASVTIACDGMDIDLPPEVEIQPLSTFGDLLTWADYAAINVRRESLNKLARMLDLRDRNGLPGQMQLFIDAPNACAGMGECGVCTFRGRRGPLLACKDGPVFDLRSVLLEI